MFSQPAGNFNVDVDDFVLFACTQAYHKMPNLRLKSKTRPFCLVPRHITGLPNLGQEAKYFVIAICLV